jgi:outer membrane protein TolC
MTSRRLLWAGSLLVGLAALGVSPARAQTLTLTEVEARAQRERPELALRRASIERANAELNGMQAKGRPTLAGRAEVSMAPGGQLVPLDSASGGDRFWVQGSQSLADADPGTFAPRPRYAALLAGKMTLLDFGRTSLGVRAAEAAISAERANLIEAKVELVRAARQAYLAWLEAHQTWQLGKSDAEVAAARTASVRELIQEGARPATEATLSAYEQQLAKLREARAHRAADVAFEGLVASLGGPLPRSVVPDLAVIEPGATGVPEATDGATNDPTLNAISMQENAARSAANAAGRWRAPQLDAAAELGLSGQETQLFPVYRASMLLSVPIFDGGALSAQAEQHRANARGLAARRQIAENKLRAHQMAAQSALRAAGEELAMTIELLHMAEALVSQADDHYRSGSDTLERVLSAQRSLVQARREVLTAKLENARARLELTPIELRD